MRFVDATKYYQELLTLLPQAKKRIVLAAMVLHIDPKTEPIFVEVEAALKRGVKVQIQTDPYSRVSRPKGMEIAEFKRRMARTTGTLRNLQKLGADVWIVGKLGFNPTKGRCHVKVTVIDDDVYSFGGVNLSESSFENVDYMLHSKDAALGDTLADLVQRIGEEQNLADFEHPLTKDSSILFDAGHPGQSVIYDRATQLAQSARRIYVVSQMVPSGKLAHALRRAETSNYFNRPLQAASLLTGALFVDKIRYRMKNSYQGSHYVHAKFILFELKDGSKALVSGSHNFSWRGVAYGTKEIALYSTNVPLWNTLYQFMSTQIVDTVKLRPYAKSKVIKGVA